MENKLNRITDDKPSFFKKLSFFQSLLMILVIFFFVCSPGWSATEMLKIRVESGRVRESPDFNAPVEFGVKKGDTVLLVKREEDWTLIKLEDGRTGWAHSEPF